MVIRVTTDPALALALWPAGWTYPAMGRVMFPIGYIFPMGATVNTCRGIATGNGPLRAGAPIEPLAVAIGGGVVIDDSRVRLPDGSTVSIHRGDGGVYGPPYLVV